MSNLISLETLDIATDICNELIADNNRLHEALEKAAQDNQELRNQNEKLSKRLQIVTRLWHYSRDQID